MQRIRSRFKKSYWRWDMWIFDDTISEFNIIGTVGFVAKLRKEILRTSWWSDIVETMLRAGFSKEIVKGQFFISIEEGCEVMQTTCREYTQFRNLKNIPTKRVDSFQYENRPSLGSQNLSSYCIDIMIESLFKDQTVSWVRIVHGINKYVTEKSEEMSIESVQQDRSTVRLGAKCLPIMFLSMK